MPRSRRLLLLALAALAFGAALRGALALVEAALEGKVRDRLVAQAAERGFVLSLERVSVRLFPARAKLFGLSLKGRGAAVQIDRVEVRASLFGEGVPGRLRRIDLGALSAELPEGVSLRVVPSAWDVSASRSRLELTSRDGPGRVLLERLAGGSLRLSLDRLDLKHLVSLRRDGAWVGDLGVVSGVCALSPAPSGGVTLEANLFSRAARLAAPEDDVPGSSPLGDPFDAEGTVTATLFREARFLDVPCVSGTAAGLRGRARGIAAYAPRDAWFDFELSVPRLELAPLLAASGLDLRAGGEELGSAQLDARVTGRMLDPKSFVVEQRLDFQPPARPLPELESLRGPFRRVLTGRHGRETVVVVDPASPDFVPLDDVPPLFVRALLTSEDANFWGHPGLDLGEVPIAMSINWVRGERSRGASTITQQLAKNLFLTRERSYRRKLQEAALALLLEPALGKRRILEIYLNVIEWGPGIHGLGPASRHYFGKNPSELTPRECAFLVALIPGPVKYQSSFASGVLSRGFSRLVNGVLYRLRSVDMLTDEELAAELEAPIRLRWTPADAVGEEEAGAESNGALASDEGPPVEPDGPTGPPEGRPLPASAAAAPPPAPAPSPAAGEPKRPD
jgi:hypothetical protein